MRECRSADKGRHGADEGRHGADEGRHGDGPHAVVAAVIAALGVSVALVAQGPAPRDLPVFPGAEGFGSTTPAGRGGVVVEVTSLADRGPGTLRDALWRPLETPRTVVFRVAGTINLEEELFVSHPFVTIAGQTAPGDGVTIAGAGLTVTTHDVLVQHLRFRPGPGAVNPETNDAISILGRHGNDSDAYNVVIDHVSASWGEDENVSTWYGAHDVTISWSIISEALDESRRGVGHSAGLIIGDGSDRVSVHHTLMAHNDFRNPLIIGGGTHDVVGNVIYNWGSEASLVADTESNSFVNFVGNVYVPGPSTRPETKPITIASRRRRSRTPGQTVPRLHVRGNIRSDGGTDADTARFFKMAVDPSWVQGETLADKISWARETFLSRTPFDVPVVTMAPTDDVYTAVLAGAGATRPRRDAVDRRVIRDVREQTGRVIDSPAEVGGYPMTGGAVPVADGDHDGMPDAWERSHGLDPDDPADRLGDLDGDGYTNIEEYLHDRARGVD